MKILFLRHGETAWNLEKKLQGRSDIPLSTHGREQVGRWQHSDTVACWYVSPLIRARQTAEILGIDNPVVSSDLIEMNWGEWEGCSIPELRVRNRVLLEEQERRGLDMLPPGGETPREVQQRILQWLQSLDQDIDVGAIAHKGVIQVVLDLALGNDHFRNPVIRVKHNRGYRFDWNGEKLDFNGEVLLLG